MAEQRRFTRVELRTRVEVVGVSGKVEGELGNLSLSGAYVRAPGRLPLGEPVRVAMVLTGQASELSIELEASVARHGEDGFALRFALERFSLDAFLHLRNVIAYQHGDADAVAREFAALLAEQAEQALL